MKMPVRKLSNCVATCLMLFVCAAHAADVTYLCRGSISSKIPPTTVTASSQADAEKKASAIYPGYSFTCTKLK